VIKADSYERHYDKLMIEKKDSEKPQTQIDEPRRDKPHPRSYRGESIHEKKLFNAYPSRESPSIFNPLFQPALQYTQSPQTIQSQIQQPQQQPQVIQNIHSTPTPQPFVPPIQPTSKIKMMNENFQFYQENVLKVKHLSIN